MENSTEVMVSGIPVAPFASMSDAVDSVIGSDGCIKPGFILAMNAEKVMSARANPDVRKVLEMATLRYADGIGVVLALRKKGIRSARVPGCDLWEHNKIRAGQHGSRVFLIGASPVVLGKVSQKLRTSHNVNIVGEQDGFFDSNQEAEILKKIVEAKPEIVTVAMGSPRQEKFIAKCREIHPDAFYMGVGGTYDVFAGEVVRAPKWAQKLNIEWLYRLFQSPKRIKRQMVLVPFLFQLLTGRL
jgi:UDP-N-acetyl-D-mannosaminouronate:lipid I N-acetyl-D-mannosaminouronosyltransferase